MSSCPDCGRDNCTATASQDRRTRARVAVRCREAVARSLRASRGCPARLRPPGRNRAGRQHGHGNEKRRRRFTSLRLGRRPAAGESGPRAPSSTRCTCAASAPSEFRRQPGHPRHVCGANREDSLSSAARNYRSRVAARLPVRRLRLSARAHQLLGLCADLVLRAAPGLQFAPDPLGAVDEFRDMVKALHRAGIEVILDVVFNHTAEGDQTRSDALFSRHRQPDLLHA